MPKFIIPFSLEYVGSMTVEAPTEAEAKKIVEDMDHEILRSSGADVDHNVETYEAEIAKVG